MNRMPIHDDDKNIPQVRKYSENTFHERTEVPNAVIAKKVKLSTN